MSAHAPQPQEPTSRIGWFLSMTIGRRLALGFTALLALLIALAGISTWELQRIDGDLHLLYEHSFAVTEDVYRLEIELLKMQRELLHLSDAEDPLPIERHQAKIAELESHILAHLERIDARFLGDMKEVADVQQALVDYRPIHEEVTKHREAGAFDAAEALTRGAAAEQIQRLEDELTDLAEAAHANAAATLEDTHMIMRDSLVFLAVIIVAAVLAGVALSVAITRSVRVPLSDLVHAAEAVATGDLTRQVGVRSRDELAVLGRAFNRMVNEIREQTEEIKQTNAENERLLLNILPAPIADRLKSGEDPIADRIPEVTVLFADIAGFTEMSAALPPDKVVSILDELFTRFDEAAAEHGIEKIKTIGDCYMAVSGLSFPVEDQTGAMILMARDMLAAVGRVNAHHGTTLAVRIGINAGPVVAGVIGKSKFIYDLWGDTVNLASRMESQGVDGRIQVTQAVHDRAAARFPMEPRGPIEIKGKGRMPTYLVGAG